MIDTNAPFPSPEDIELDAFYKEQDELIQEMTEIEYAWAVGYRKYGNNFKSKKTPSKLGCFLVNIFL